MISGSGLAPLRRADRDRVWLADAPRDVGVRAGRAPRDGGHRLPDSQLEQHAARRQWHVKGAPFASEPGAPSCPSASASAGLVVHNPRRVARLGPAPDTCASARASLGSAAGAARPGRAP